jgi:hypothetical protein
LVLQNDLTLVPLDSDLPPVELENFPPIPFCYLFLKHIT